MAVMKIGKALINRVEELRIPNNIAAFTKNQELIAMNRYWLYPHWLDDKGGFDLVFQSWIIEVGGRVILIDPCNGNGIAHPVPFFDNLKVPYIERMQASGYRPKDIDFVVCTHMHHDHCGWNTHLRNGKWIPTFPKARYILQQTEYDWWRANHNNLPQGDLNVGVFGRAIEPVVKAGLVDFAAGTRRLIPGVQVELALGHTPGHQMLHMLSAGQHAFFAGDSFHHPIQLLEPTSAFAGGSDLAKVAETRQRLVDLSAELDAYVIAAHISAPYALRASRAGRVLHFTAGITA